MSATAPRWIAIGARIRQARVAAGFSQERLAEEVGTSRRHVIRLERGEHRPNKTTLSRIAVAVGIDPRLIDPDADEEDRQLAATLLDLLRLHIRDIVQTELAAQTPKRVA